MTGPRDAEITVAGGGAVGAYFLARDARRDAQHVYETYYPMPAAS